MPLGLSSGLDATFRALASSDNEAAVPVLIAALDLAQHETREAAFVALLARHSEAAELEVLRRWNEMSERWKVLVAERPGWIAGAVARALAGADPSLFQAACDAAVRTREYEMIPVLVGIATAGTHPQAERAAAIGLQLVELLAEEVAAPRDYHHRRDPQLLRQHVLGCLERAAAEFHRHGRRGLVEALLLLSDRENATLKRTLQAPDDRNFAPLADVLATSSRWGVQRLLLTFLDDPHAPLAALNLLARRRDVAFVRHLTRKIGADPSPVVRNNLRRIESIPWMQNNLALLDALHEAEQAGAVQLATLSGTPEQQALEAVAYVVRHGKLAGRRTAAQALARFAGPTADRLAVQSLDDDDPQVRAAAAAQLRQRNVPGAIHRLLPLLDSPHQCEREAVQASLEEFHFERFLARFDELSEEARASAGPLVRRIDPDAISKLRAELEAPARSRRRRALEIVVALKAAADLSETIIALLDDDDQYLRIDAIRALATSDKPAAREAIRQALLDSHPLVQKAAESALAGNSVQRLVAVPEVAELAH
jgi:HEAT repeat protein